MVMLLIFLALELSDLVEAQFNIGTGGAFALSRLLPAPPLRKKCPTNDWAHLKFMTFEHTPEIHTTYEPNFIADLGFS